MTVTVFHVFATEESKKAEKNCRRTFSFCESSFLREIETWRLKDDDITKL